MLFDDYNKKENEDGVANDSVSIYGTDTQTNGQLEKDPLLIGLDASKERLGNAISGWSRPALPAERSEAFKKGFVDFMMPVNTLGRRKLVYATSQEALDDVVGEYYNSRLKPLFERYRDESHKKGRDEYLKNISVIGGDASISMKEAIKSDDPMKVIEKTMAEVDDDELRKLVSPMATYAGYDTDEYVEMYVKPALQEKMAGEYVKENMPKSRTEYILRSSIGNSLVGKAAMLSSGISGSATSRFEREGLASYKANRVDDFLSGLGNLIVDLPVFAAFGSSASEATGKATAYFTERLAGKVMLNNLGKSMSMKFARNIAKRAITENLSAKILQNSMTQGLTLGSYDVANSVADDILYDDKVNLGKAAGALTKGLLTGTALGVVGTPLRVASRGFTGGKKLLSSAGVLTAESGVFTLSNEAEKLANGIKVEPIDLLYDFGESTATLLAMKAVHWRPKGAAAKLDSKGNIKKMFQLSNSERQEMKELNMNPDEFMHMVEKELRMPSLGGSERLKREYSSLMSNKELSASARSKLMYLVENRVTSTPPITFDFEVKNKDGVWSVVTYDYNGNKIEQRDFPHAGNAKSYLMVERGNIRKNRIITFESELTDGLNSQNFLRQAGLFAQEKGVAVEEIAEALRKKAEDQPLTEKEKVMIDEILFRSKSEDTGMEYYLDMTRRNIERKYGLKDGKLIASVNLPFYRCSENVNRALDEYESFVRGEVELLKSGNPSTLPFTYIDKDAYGRKPELFGTGEHEEFKPEVEYDDLFTMDEKNHLGQRQWDYSERKIEVPVSDGSPYLWSYIGVKNTPVDIQRYQKRINELSRMFGYKINVITDERQIVVPFEKAKTDEERYGMTILHNNLIKSLGWKNKDFICINLPNISNIEELERTVVHELVCHQGLEYVFGYHLRDFLEEVYRRADKNVRTGIDKVGQLYRGQEHYKIVEEYLAKIMEKSTHTIHERGLLARFKEWMRNLLIKLNIYTGKNRKITEKELEAIMRQHLRYRMRNATYDSYLKDVYGRFESSRYPAAEYHNENHYLKSTRDKIVNNEYMRFVPEYLRSAKQKYRDVILPENLRQDYIDGVDIGGIKDLGPNDYFRFIGERGADNIARHEGYIGDLELEKAKRKRQFDMSAEDIKSDTGWERGMDKRWRKEISDNHLQVIDHIENSLAENNSYLSRKYERLKCKPVEEWGVEDYKDWDYVMEHGKQYFENAKLEDIVRDPTFFISYPDLKELPVEIHNDAVVPLRYDSRNKKVIVDSEVFLGNDAGMTMSGLLQQIIQDYEGFSRAVSLNQYGLNSRIAKQYKDAIRTISRFEEMEKENPGFDKNESIDEGFREAYGMSMNEFKEKYPSLDEYMIYRLTGRNIAFSGDVEVRNVMRRKDFNEFQGRMLPAEATEDMPRDQQKLIMNMTDLRKYFVGPLDILTDFVEEANSKNLSSSGRESASLRRSRLDFVQPTMFDKVFENYSRRQQEERLKRKVVKPTPSISKRATQSYTMNNRLRLERMYDFQRAEELKKQFDTNHDRKREKKK